MKTFTIPLKKRLERYKKALKLYEEDIASFNYDIFKHGLCFYLADKNTNCKYYPTFVSDMKRLYPEITIPESRDGMNINDNYYGYWWPLKDTEIRIKTLKDAIDLAKEKIKIKQNEKKMGN